MLDESTCYFRGVGPILSSIFYFRWKILLANCIDPDQMQHYVASDLGPNRLLMTLSRVSWQEWVMWKQIMAKIES